MKKNENVIIKAFTCLSRQEYFDAKAPYMKGLVDVVIFGNFDSEGNGCEYEAKMKWVVIESKTSPRLCIFHDAFIILDEHKELIDEIKKLHRKYFSPDDFCRLLLRLGYKDQSDHKLS